MTYALKPVGENASLFRAYPDPWKVFVADEASVGRYMLAAQMASPPPRAFLWCWTVLAMLKLGCDVWAALNVSFSITAVSGCICVWQQGVLK